MSNFDDFYYKKFLLPLYSKYADDPNFIVKGEDGSDLYNVQYALLKESVDGSAFQPVLWEEDGRHLVIGFKHTVVPECVLFDAQYSRAKDGAIIERVLINSMLFLGMTGQTQSLLSYVGLADIYVLEGA